MQLGLLGVIAAISTVEAADPIEVWVRAPGAAERERLRTLPAGFVEVERGGWVLVHVEPGGLAALEAAGLGWAPAAPKAAPAGYRSPEEMAEDLADLAAAYPDRVALAEVGRSAEGRPLVAATITAAAAPRATWRVVGAHHGDEPPSGELAYDLAAHLAARYGEDPGITALLDQDAVVVLPHLNPDGIAADSRYNARDVDLNRNYGHEWSAAEFRAGAAPFSEPETRAARALAAWTPFAAGLALHTGAGNLGWVWNYTLEPAPDDAFLASLAARYAGACSLPGFWITNGAAWYVTRGDATDWAYGRAGAHEFTLELSEEKAPAADELDDLLAHHLGAMLDFLQWPAVLAGQVRDAQTGRGIPATIAPAAGAPILSGPDGRFARLLPEDGAIEVTISAPGYGSVAAALDSAERSEIALQPAALSAARPSPAVLSRGGDGAFSLEEEAQSVTLLRPGETAVSARRAGDGWAVDLAALAPGPWTLLIDGRAAPRALLVGEIDDRARLTGAGLDGAEVWVAGEGLGAGSQAFALWGEDRAPVALPLLQGSASSLTFDGSALADAPHPVDLVVLSAGYQLAVADLAGAALVDETPPPAELLPADAPYTGPLRVAGCSAAPVPPALSPILLVLAAFLNRQDAKDAKVGHRGRGDSRRRGTAGPKALLQQRLFRSWRPWRLGGSKKRPAAVPPLPRRDPCSSS